MPRGYLKHSKDDVGRKASRGGGSRNDTRRKKQAVHTTKASLNWQDSFREDLEFFDYCRDVDVDSFDQEVDFSNGSDSSCVSHPTTVQECPICFEVRPLISLSKKCWHDPACYDCLRRFLVTDAQKDSKNYPLRCFHPQCRQPIHESQLKKHGLLRSRKEVVQHYRMVELAKRYRGGEERRLLHCPHCDHPRSIVARGNSREQDTVFRCRSCTKSFMFSPIFATLRAVEAFGADNVGPNEGWARCPNCRMIISKGEGCNHMVCFCGHEFYWDQVKHGTDLPEARLPHEEIPLWW